jgi:hypothetical protein
MAATGFSKSRKDVITLKRPIALSPVGQSIHKALAGPLSNGIASVTAARASVRTPSAMPSIAEVPDFMANAPCLGFVPGLRPVIRTNLKIDRAFGEPVEMG